MLCEPFFCGTGSVMRGLRIRPKKLEKTLRLILGAGALAGLRRFPEEGTDAIGDARDGANEGGWKIASADSAENRIERALPPSDRLESSLFNPPMDAVRCAGKLLSSPGDP